MKLFQVNDLLDILVLVGQDPGLAEMSGTFNKILIIGLIPNLWYAALTAYLRNQQIVLPALIVAGVAFVVNVSLVIRREMKIFRSEWISFTLIGYIWDLLEVHWQLPLHDFCFQFFYGLIFIGENYILRHGLDGHVRCLQEKE